ncbi:MAG TPA: RHS repeat-associated core domain-containing protein [Anaerolineales bacterium]|nr:RHS repeat-associated core domain-containing protein [Anaerolineales bacterium]
MRYKLFGEVRYTWKASQTTTPAYALTRFTFTGQYSHMDDPSTSGVTEGFGLMFYNARWYDPSLGRFAQADTIIPPGVQGLDRYAYVNNSPVNFVDPTGHTIACYGDRFDDGPQCTNEDSPSKWYYDNWKYRDTSVDEFLKDVEEDINNFVVFYEDIFSPSSGISLGKDIIQPNEGACQAYGVPCWGAGVLIDHYLTIKEAIGKFTENIGGTYKKYVIDAPTSIYTPTHYLQTQTSSKIPSATLTISPMPTPTGFTPPTILYNPTAIETPTPTITQSPTLTPIPVTITTMPTVPYVTPTYFQ